MAYKYKQGKYVPRFPEKYRGDANKIIFRSGLEKKFFHHFDTRKNILEWASEEFFIMYDGPDCKQHRYFVDVWVKVKTKDGHTKEFIIEIKPFEQTRPPKKPSRITKAYKRKVAEYLVNKAKWDAAEKFAEKNNIQFTIMTERDIK